MTSHNSYSSPAKSSRPHKCGSQGTDPAAARQRRGHIYPRTSQIDSLGHSYLLRHNYPYAIIHSVPKGVFQPVTPTRSKQTLGIPMSASTTSPTSSENLQAFLTAPRATVCCGETDHGPASPMRTTAFIIRCHEHRCECAPVSGWMPLGTSMLSVGAGLALAHAAASASNACEFLLRGRGMASGSTRASIMRSCVSGRSFIARSSKIS
jgi:hypothetical protein